MGVTARAGLVDGDPVGRAVGADVGRVVGEPVGRVVTGAGGVVLAVARTVVLDVTAGAAVVGRTVVLDVVAAAGVVVRDVVLGATGAVVGAGAVVARTRGVAAGDRRGVGVEGRAAGRGTAEPWARGRRSVCGAGPAAGDDSRTAAAVAPASTSPAVAPTRVGVPAHTRRDSLRRRRRRVGVSSARAAATVLNGADPAPTD